MSDATSARERAVGHVRSLALDAQSRARERIADVLDRARPASDRDVTTALALASSLPYRARVTINFHPDRLLPDGLRTIAQALLDDGIYKSQFETGLSNGSRTAFAGGARDGWEAKLFSGAYHVPPAPARERPKYGALDVLQHADGGSPRFGSCYVVLRRHVNERCTFTWGDSHLGPQALATVDAFEPVLAAMLEAAETEGRVLAVTTSVPELVRRLSPIAPAASNAAMGRALDDYVEAQVHGDIVLSRDVEALVVDPAFETTETGELLRELGVRHGFPTRHHAGFVLARADVPTDFRGPRMPALAERVCEHHAGGASTFDAATIGRAAATLHRDPASWQDWDTPEETLQHLKQLWHVLVQHGHERPPR